MNEQDDGDNDEDDGENEAIFHLPPPPEATYSSMEELDKAMHTWTLEHGYEMVRRASKKNARGQLYKRYYHCSKHGKLANTGKLTDATRVRVNRKSNRINCPMSLAVVAVDPSNPDGAWEIRHRSKTHHNHGPMNALEMAGHRRRARNEGVERAVDGLFEIGSSTSQVLQFLQKTNPGGLFTRTDVANMKLKFKKFGTCAEKRDVQTAGDACTGCKSRKIRCDSGHPCSNCAQAGQQCAYDGGSAIGPAHIEDTPISAPAPVMQQVLPPQPPPVVNPSRTQAILADLQNFQAAHVRPTRLTLQSSAVEVLAASSCGNGASFNIVPMLEHEGQWTTFRNAMSDAAMKENSFEVLMGEKVEPIKPTDDVPVEEWNEYIRQLAIYNRRNISLVGAIVCRLSPALRPRIAHFRHASAIWQTLEDVCTPRGSEAAYRSFLDLHAITLQNSKDLKDYIVRLEMAWNELNRVPHLASEKDFANGAPGRQHLTHFDNDFAAKNTASSTTRGMRDGPLSSRRAHFSNVMSEEMLCFLFLRNLGPEFKRMADTICATGNVGGFGTGRRLGFPALTRSAIEWDSTQRRERDRNGI